MIAADLEGGRDDSVAWHDGHKRIAFHALRGEGGNRVILRAEVCGGLQNV